MSRVTYSIKAVIPADAEWHRMKTVWEACIAADVEIPAEVMDFFAGETPRGGGKVLYIGDEKHAAVTYVEEDDFAHYDVELDKLPKNAKFVRFCIDW
jgi:hypothetical protein